MFALLSPRLWLALGLAAALAFSHFYVYRAGKNNVRLEWQASVSVANDEARKLERARQRRADEAVALSTKRAVALALDSGRSGDALDSVRGAISARKLAEKSLSAATKRADTYEKLLLDGGAVIQEMARSCDRHVNDVQTLLEAWPR